MLGEKNSSGRFFKITCHLSRNVQGTLSNIKMLSAMLQLSPTAFMGGGGRVRIGGNNIIDRWHVILEKRPGDPTCSLTNGYFVPSFKPREVESFFVHSSLNSGIS